VRGGRERRVNQCEDTRGIARKLKGEKERPKAGEREREREGKREVVLHIKPWEKKGSLFSAQKL